MPKFYVETGGYRTVVDAPDLREGARRGVSRIIDEHDFPPLGVVTCVSESGFDEECTKDDSLFADTVKLLSELGLMEP